MKAWHDQESTHVQAELMTERSREVMSQGPQSTLVLTIPFHPCPHSYPFALTYSQVSTKRAARLTTYICS